MKLQKMQCDFMTQPCIMDSTACEYFTHGYERYARSLPERIAKACVSLEVRQSETGKAIAPFLLKIGPSGVF